jgi:hypothetical protein
MFTIINSHEFTKHSSIIVGNILSNILCDYYVTHDTIKTNGGNEWLNIDCLLKFIDSLKDDDKNEITIRVFPILKQLAENKCFVNFPEVNNLAKNLIIELIGDEKFGPVIKLILVSELCEVCNNLQDIVLIIKQLGEGMRDCDELCKLTLKFPCGNVLKVSDIIIPHFECFKYDNLDGEQLCFYNYKCLKTIIDFFFTAHMDEDCDTLELLLGMDKLGYKDQSLILHDKLFTKLLESVQDTLLNMLNNNPFEEFIRQLGILCNMSGKFKDKIITGINTFLEAHEQKYDVGKLISMSFFTEYLINTTLGKNIIKKYKYVPLFDKIVNEDNFKELYMILFELKHDPLKIFNTFIEDHPDCLNKKEIIKILPKDIFQHTNIFPKLNASVQANLYIKHKNYECMDTILLNSVSHCTIEYVAKKYIKHNPEAHQKWEILHRDTKNNDAKWGYDVTLGDYNFTYIHSLNPIVHRNIVSFTYVGYIVDIFKDLDGSIIGIFIKLEYWQTILINNEIFIGDTYTNNSKYDIFHITKLCSYPNESNISYQTPYLHGISHKSYGDIYLDKNDIDRIGISNIKIDAKVYVDNIL